MSDRRPAVILFNIPDAYGPLLRDSLARAGFDALLTDGHVALFEWIAQHPPDCVACWYAQDDPRGFSLITELKSDAAYGHLPLVLFMPPGEPTRADWETLRADDYLVLPRDLDEVPARLRLCVIRSARDINANPLTGLPGNLTIIREAERRLREGRRFAMAYADLDHFKPYNDKYGFNRGDEVLRMTARVLANVVRRADHPDAWLGHVGGDDFILLLPPELIARVCTEICEYFDLVVPDFYDPEDVARGGIESVDRQGNHRFFPIMGCSIAVVDTGLCGATHIAELSARAAEVKKAAKNIAGSAWVLDRRGPAEPPLSPDPSS
ncbi:MAG: diguanylate cyclase [Candidatus Hydrogenedentes bacterium]|nr:diguanylate cyclase [Candidatus Hydrogenedentota bacterium]